MAVNLAGSGMDEPMADEPYVRTFEHLHKREPDFRVWVAKLRGHGWALLEREADIGPRGWARYYFVATRREPDWPAEAKYRAVVRVRVYEGSWHFKVEGEDGWSGRGVSRSGTEEGILGEAGKALVRSGLMPKEYELTLVRE